MFSNDHLPQVSVSTRLLRLAEGELVLLEVSGPLTARTCAALREPLRTLADQGAARVLVDLSGVTVVDAAGLGVLVGALRRTQLASDGRQLSFLDEGGTVVKRARLLGLSRLLGLLDRPGLLDRSGLLDRPGPAELPAGANAPRPWFTAHS